MQAPNSSLKPESLQAVRQKMTDYWIKKTIPVAIAVSVLPILGIGALNYGVGQSILSERSSDTAQPQSQNRSSLLLLLLLGAGITAGLAGGLCWLWLKVFVNALVKQSTQLGTQADQFQVAESLQDLGRTIGYLQEQPDVQSVLETAAREVRSLLKTDRALVFMTGKSGRFSQMAEDLAADQASLLNADSPLSTPLEELFKVPMGYVQVCSQVEGSDLPKSHQLMLSNLAVQAQMVTRITLDNDSKGLLVVQQCGSPRDWTNVEHQLFAAIAKQIGIALERKTAKDQSATVRTISSGSHSLWSNYEAHCFQLAESSRNQSAHLKSILDQMQTTLNLNPVFGTGLQQVLEQIQCHRDMLHTSDKAVNQSVTSIAEMQETLAQTSHSSQQLIELGQKIAQVSSTIKTLADQVNYQAMNASITAKKHSKQDDAWTLDFANEVLKITRELAQQTSELDALSSQTVQASQTVSSSVDRGAEQILISAEWFRESRQQLNQISAVNGQLDASLKRLLDSHQEQERTTSASHQQLLELDRWLHQAAEESSSMAQSIEQVTQRAFA